MIVLITARAEGRTLHARVIGVNDSDTIHVVDARKRLHRIRIQGIDAPVMGQPLGILQAGRGTMKLVAADSLGRRIPT